MLPDGLRVDWSPEQVAEAMHVLTDAILASASETTNTSGVVPHLVDEIELLDQDLFRFRGRVYPLSAGQWELLSQIIRNGGAIDFATLGENLWGDDMTPRNRIDQAVHSLRSSLKAMKVPFTVSGRRQVAKVLRESKKTAKKR
jgi:hypothetical protein